MPTDPAIRLVVLDWAGTTLDFGCLAPSGAFVRAFAERGIEVSIREARGPMGLHKKDHLREMLRTPRIAAAWRSRFARDWAEEDVVDLYQSVTPMQVAAAAEHSELIPGVIDVVRELKVRGIRIAGSTGYFHEAAQVCYTAAAQQGYTPDFSICADEVPAGRPQPWMIFRSMEALGVYPPKAVVKVGDTLVDIRDGRNAGCWSFGVVDSSNEMGLSREEFAALSETERDTRRKTIREAYFEAGAHAVVNTLSELPSAIEGLTGSP